LYKKDLAIISCVFGRQKPPFQLIIEIYQNCDKLPKIN
jgi:hypothetical protein